MLTDRGRFALALGGASYPPRARGRSPPALGGAPSLAGWAFGSRSLYPIALGLVLAVVAATLWVRLTARPVRLKRSIIGGDHVAGDDVTVRLPALFAGRLGPGNPQGAAGVGR